MVLETLLVAGLSIRVLVETVQILIKNKFKNIKMEWTEKLLIKFALFHAKRMKGANQTDSDFYAKQSLKIFPI
jgi:hypothetical protein